MRFALRFPQQRGNLRKQLVVPPAEGVLPFAAVPIPLRANLCRVRAVLPLSSQNTGPSPLEASGLPAPRRLTARVPYRLVCVRTGL